MLVPSYLLIGDEDPLGTRNPNEDRYGDGSNKMGMGMGCYNPVGNSPLTYLSGISSLTRLVQIRAGLLS
jgi:hypothetical protein